MIYMVAGALAGLLLGVLVLLLVFRLWGHAFQDQGLIVLLVVALCVVGGLTAGAYAVQALIYRLERKKKKQERKAKKSKRRR
jgi:thiol:disulfide interchange protein